MFNNVDYENWDRKEIYELFKNRHFVVSVEIDISAFYSFIKKESMKFYPCACWCINNAANMDEFFRMGTVDGHVGHWDSLNSHYTLMRKHVPLFTQTVTKFNSDYRLYYKSFLQDREEAENANKLCYYKEPCPDAIHISIMPNIQFTALGIYGDVRPVDHNNTSYIPFVVMGKFYQKDGKTLLPVMADFYHAANDGMHAEIFIRNLEKSFAGFGQE